jgi:hypothetical protein
MFTQTIKRLLAKSVIAAMLFMQLAVAAYACPAVEGPAAVIATVIADDAMHAAMPGCEMTGNGSLNLCLQHCQAGDQSVQTLPHVAVPAFAAVTTLLVLDPVQPRTGLGITVAFALPERVTSPPPLARFGVLRI